MGAVSAGQPTDGRSGVGSLLGSAPSSPAAEESGIPFPWQPFLPLLAIPFVGTSPDSLGRIVMAMQLIFLVMAIRRPVLVLGALALSELTIRNYILTFPASLLIVMPHLARELDMGPRARPMVIAASLFMAVGASVTFIVLDLSQVITLLRSSVIDLAVFLQIPLVIRSRRDIIQIGLVALVIATASAAVGVAEQFAGARFLAIPHNTLINVDAIDWGGRSLGFDLNPILLTDHLMLLLFPAAGLLLMSGISKQFKVVLLLAAATMVTALFFTETRSWIFSTAAATVAMALVLRGRAGLQIVFVLMIAAGGFWYWADASGSRYSLGPESDTSAAARPVLWSAGLQMALDNPLVGVGTDQFKEHASDYARSIDSGVLDSFEVGYVLGSLSPHNDYLNVWLSFGIAGLVLYGILMVLTAANFIGVARTTRDPLLRGVAVGCLGALAAFAVNSFFHNLLTSALTIWILAGFSLALTKVASSGEALQPEPRS